MLIERTLVEATAPLLKRGDKVEIARRLEQQKVHCRPQDVSNFFTGYRNYDTSEKGQLIFTVSLEIIEARKKAAEKENAQLAQRVQAVAA